MRDFITCLEFLTRVRFSKRTDWRDEDFSHSVPYFPLVGLVIGFLLAAVNYSLFYIETPLFLRVTLLLLAEIIITGGLMYDGFMDTADGVFSARSRERMLEIMKDSHVAVSYTHLTLPTIYSDLGFTDDVRCDTNFYGSFYCQFSLCA